MPTMLEAVRAEALFVWCLQSPQRPAADNVREAVSTTLRRLGSRGCAALVAEEFGEHPDTAVNRMTWVLGMVHDVYPATAPDVTRSTCRSHWRSRTRGLMRSGKPLAPDTGAAARSS